MKEYLPKYRAWDLIEGKFVHVGSFLFAPDGSIKDVEIVKVINGKAAPEWRRDGEDIILILSTGLLDNKGCELWQGDIVKQNLRTEFGSFIELVGVMEWSDASWTIKFSSDVPVDFSGRAGKPTVIGTIYTTPHLLEKNKSVDKHAPIS